MMGLFQENGPCRIKNDSSGVRHNPTSWNEFANVLYIDQPVGTGFSYGTEDVDTSLKAAQDVWKFLQIWFADPRFHKYVSRDFGIWTESYGGHYGPVFAKYFLDQNDAIRRVTITGEIINLQALGIGNGLTDPITQYPEYVNYAQFNPFYPLVAAPAITAANIAWSLAGGCRDLIQNCNSGIDPACPAAQGFCNRNILDPLHGIWDPYYVLSLFPAKYPPRLEPYLLNTAVTSVIGSMTTWQMFNLGIYFQFAAAGDWMRTTKGVLEEVINRGVRTVIYAGEADYIVNYMGVEAMVNSLNTIYSTEFAGNPFHTYRVRGRRAGKYKNAGRFSYLRVFGAGHEVPAYKYFGVRRGAAALQMFQQIMSDDRLSST